MEKEFYEKLKKRAEDFFEEAKLDFKLQKFDLCIFHLEQATQLFLKSFLLRKIGDFPKTHELLELFNECEKVEEKLKEIKKRNLLVISLLRDAYIASRYLPRSYSKEECEVAFKLWKELKGCLG